MNAAEIMTSNVITIAPDASVRDLARVLLTKRISAVPVIDDRGRLVGIVSKGDLHRCAEAATEPSWSLSAETSAAPDIRPLEFLRPHARKVGDIMTRDVVTARPDTPLAEIAALLEDHEIKQVPILTQRIVIGIVGRADFHRVMSDLRREANANAADDPMLKIVNPFEAIPSTGHSVLNVVERDGVVALTRTPASKS